MRAHAVLGSWGWDSEWAERFDELAPAGTEPARVSEQHRKGWTLQTEGGPAHAIVPRRTADVLPVVGDWVTASPPTSPDDDWLIRVVLPRRSKFSRGAAGGRDAEQVVATNVDRLWIMHGLDRPINPRTLERYLAAAWESGARPEIVLSKLDLAEDPDEDRKAVESVALGVPIWLTSTTDSRGTSEIARSLTPGRTIALVGPSGVGKSSLINRLAGSALLPEGEVRPGDRKGRHTTTRRQLVRLPSGALLVDTPGIRSLPLWQVSEGLDAAFPEIERLAEDCRFRDCRHDSEPGCAVLAAVADKGLAPERLAGYRKLAAEAKGR